MEYEYFFVASCVSSKAHSCLLSFLKLILLLFMFDLVLLFLILRQATKSSSSVSKDSVRVKVVNLMVMFLLTHLNVCQSHKFASCYSNILIYSIHSFIKIIIIIKTAVCCYQTTV